MSKNNVSIFEKLLIRATVSAGWSLQSVENKEVNELFSFINPTIKLPGWRALGGRILNNEVKSLQLQLENKKICYFKKRRWIYFPQIQNSDDDEFEMNELLLNLMHPALDNVVKWQLTDIFRNTIFYWRLILKKNFKLQNKNVTCL